MLNCKYIATGHYAQIRKQNDRFVVSKGLDEIKDQSYVLWGVSQECLSRTIFPIGGYHKEDIRKMALSKGYKQLAQKVRAMKYVLFLIMIIEVFKTKGKGFRKKVAGGSFITSDGKVVGTHNGYPFYTIGQRKLGVSLGSKPTYVIGIDADNNTVIVGDKEELQKQERCILRM